MTLPPPYPVEVFVCSVCEEPWDPHHKRATRRARDEYAEAVEAWDGEGEAPTAVLAQVTLEDCVALLKIANQGPMGPAGPQGMSGPQGRSATT